MKKILITGVTGFAGKYLLELLIDSNVQIFGTYHSNGSDQKLGDKKDSITLFQVDLTDKTTVEKLVDDVMPDEVYHLAAQTSPSESFKDPASTFSTNINSQLYLLDALKKVPQARIITVSSSEIYGKVMTNELPVNEENALRPLSPYSVSKITQDYLSYFYFPSYGSQIIRVRPFNHTGPGQDKFVVPAFAKQIAEIEKNNGDPIIKVGNLGAKKDFSDVRDIVRAYMMLMEKGEPGEAYNVGSGKSIEIKEILEKLLSFSTTNITPETDQSLVRDVEVEEVYADNSKITQATGWKPEIPLEKTLRDSLDYFRKVV